MEIDDFVSRIVMYSQGSEVRVIGTDGEFYEIDNVGIDMSTRTVIITLKDSTDSS